MSSMQLLKKYEGERQRTLVYSRVMGYLTCRDRYNDSKKQEAQDRTYFSEPCGCCR